MVRFVAIPQYSIRTLLLITTACAVVFSIFGLGIRGNLWAAGISIGIVAVVVALAVHALFFAVIWTFAKGSTMAVSQYQPQLSQRAPRSVAPVLAAMEEGGQVELDSAPSRSSEPIVAAIIIEDDDVAEKKEESPAEPEADE